MPKYISLAPMRYGKLWIPQLRIQQAQGSKSALALQRLGPRPHSQKRIKDIKTLKNIKNISSTVTSTPSASVHREVLWANHQATLKRFGHKHEQPELEEHLEETDLFWRCQVKSHQNFIKISQNVVKKWKWIGISLSLPSLPITITSYNAKTRLSQAQPGSSSRFDGIISKKLVLNLSLVTMYNMSLAIRWGTLKDTKIIS